MEAPSGPLKADALAATRLAPTCPPMPVAATRLHAQPCTSDLVFLSLKVSHPHDRQLCHNSVQVAREQKLLSYLQVVAAAPQIAFPRTTVLPPMPSRSLREGTPGTVMACGNPLI